MAVSAGVQLSRKSFKDGAGTCSSAFWGVPRERDFLRPLRALWLARLQTPGLLSGILSHLVSPCKDMPLSDRVLSLFEQELRTFLQVESDDVWTKLLAFRLNLWHSCAMASPWG